MKILEVADRTPDLINQLLEVWEKLCKGYPPVSVRQRNQKYQRVCPAGVEWDGTFDDCTKVKQAAPWLLWGLRTARWKCCLSPRKSAEKGSGETPDRNTGLKAIL